MPTTAQTGVRTSAIGTPIRIGGSSGEPLVSMAPLSAWMMVSMARTPGLPPAPNPLIEQ